jgi:ribosomal protein S14
MKGVCEYHRSVAVEAEVLRETVKAVYVELRCPECGRSRGIRRLVKEPSA